LLRTAALKLKGLARRGCIPTTRTRMLSTVKSTTEPMAPTTANFTKRYADNGTYTVTLTVTDPSNATSTATTTAVIANAAPTAIFVAPSSVNEGSAYTLSLTGQDAGTADRPTLGYAFDCGSGVYAAWSTTVKSVTCPSHPNQLELPLTVRGKVRDKDGAETEVTKTVKIVDVAPVVVFAAASPTTIAAGGSVSFQGSFSDPGVADGPWTWHLNWGDGTPVETAAVNQPGDLGTFTHTFSRAGTYSAFLRVTDREGKTKSVTVLITVNP
jgi:PKD repeat protein